MSKQSLVNVEVEGLDRAIAKVRSLASALEAQEVEKVLLKGAQIVQREAKLRVRVKSGRLKSSIKARISKRRGRMVAGAFSAVDYKRAPHAYLVEYGTRHSRAKPYFRPAWDMTKGEVKKTVEDGLRDLVQGAVK